MSKFDHNKPLTFWIIALVCTLLVSAIIIWQTNENLGLQDQATHVADLEVDQNLLMPGRNHSIQADDYAYDAGQVQRVIAGEEDYSGEKLVFLTFDDGPNHVMTPVILDILKEENVPATFFQVGKYIDESTQDVMVRQIQEGHALAVHSYSHDYNHLYPDQQGHADNIMDEYHQTVGAMRNLLGENFSSKVFRYPGGHMSWRGLAQADQALADQGIHWVDWNAAIGDALADQQIPESVDQAMAFHEKSLTSYPDSDMKVVLMHDAANKELTYQTLPSLIQYYRDQGYRFAILK